MTQNYPWHFMGFLVLVYLFPYTYTVTNIFWVGRISNDAFAITEQYEIIALAINVLEDFIPVGALVLTAQHFHNNKKIIEILKAGLIIQAALSLSLTVLIIFFNQEFIAMIGTPGSIVNPTREYLLLKSITIPFYIISFTLLMTIKSLKKGKEAFLLVAISIALNILLDLFLISNTPISLQMGVAGVVIAYLITQTVLTVIAVAYLFPLLKITVRSFLTTSWRQEVFPIIGIGGWSGLECAVRMLGLLWILIILNGLGTNEYGGFGIATWILWILLNPIFAIKQGTSILVGNYFSERRYDALLNIVKTSLLVVIVFTLAVVVTGIFWWHHVSLFLNPNPGIVTYSVAAYSGLIIGFIGYGIGLILRSIFIGTGQTRYIFYVGMISNLGIILPFFILVKAGILTPTFPMVMMVFLIACSVDPILVIYWARKVVAGFPAGNDDAAASA
jgi:Na+-driven multidrug efflux pump